MLVHNALARKSVQTISVPVQHAHAEIQVLSGSAKVRRHDVFDAVPVHANQAGAPRSLVFSTELEPLSDARFLVTNKASSKTAKTAARDVTADVVTLENDLVRVKIDKDTGSIVSLLNKARNIEVPLTSHVGYYQGFQDPRDQRSGAYIFRPDSKTVYSVHKGGDVTLLDVHSGAAASPTRVAFRIGKWVTLEYRVNDGDAFVEVEWTVGSIPIDDKVGKEVIVRFDTAQHVASRKTLFTDSNGMEFVERVRSHRETWNLTLHDDQEFVAANYFPITTGAYIKDDKVQLNIVTDRAQGAASLEDGQVEVMVHRRLLADDGKGVGENLNETESFFDTALKRDVTRGLIVRGSLFVGVDSAAEGMASLRSKMEQTFYAPLVAFRKPVADDEPQAKVPWLRASEFPPNVGLTTLQELSKDCVMVRLTHLFAVDEHATLSKPATVDFAKLLSVQNGAIAGVTELLLTGVAPLASQTREPHGLKWKTIEPEGRVDASAPSMALQGTEVTLQAMEVRSFRVCFAKATTAVDVTDYLRNAKEEAVAKIAAAEPDVEALDEVIAFE